MDIIFDNGAKVINQEAMDIVRGILQSEHDYEINAEYNIYGDDYKIEITGDPNQCILILKDYDKHQQLESRIDLVLGNDEMDQLIAVMKSVRGKM